MWKRSHIWIVSLSLTSRTQRCTIYEYEVLLDLVHCIHKGRDYLGLGFGGEIAGDERKRGRHEERPSYAVVVFCQTLQSRSSFNVAKQDGNPIIL